MLSKILSIGKGYRTYIGTFLLFLIGGALYLGWLDIKLAEALALIIGALTGVALRAAIK